MVHLASIPQEPTMSDFFDDLADMGNAQFDATPTKKDNPKFARRKFTCDPLGWYEWYCWYWLGRRYGEKRLK